MVQSEEQPQSEYWVGAAKMPAHTAGTFFLYSPGKKD